MNIVEVNDVIFSYDNVMDVLKGISFKIEEGSYTTIIGHNGSGKSTIAKLIMGLLEKKSGSIKIDGLEVNQENIASIRKKIGIVFQNPDNQFIASTVKDDIAFGLENHRVPTSDMDSIILDYAGYVGMSDFLDAEPEHLSGGQKQRVAIAGVLAMKPKILIFDEATSMLDPVGKEEIRNMIYKLHKEQGLTVISITHDIEEAYNSDYCIVLSDGKTYMEGKPDEVFNHHEELKKIGLDIPFVDYVKSLFKKKGIKLKSNDIEGMVDELWQLHSKM